VVFANALIGVADADSGRDAAELAKLLVERGGRLQLVHVQPAEQLTWAGLDEAALAADRERALRLLAAVREAARIDAAVRCISAATPGRGLHELAEEEGADLLVVGSSRRGLLGRVLLGDDTSAALSGAPCAVAVATAGFAERPQLARIGVGYNGSPESEQALGAARQLARRHGATLAALEAVFVALPMRGGSWYLAQELVDAANARLAQLEDVEPLVQYGVPSEELAQFSATLDLLVVGSRGYGPLGRLIHGSTSRQLARSARCRLLVLPRTPGSKAAGGAGADQRESAGELRASVRDR
jgi:nucleotide-binding universal stress UspA family protein